jgi:REP element-mobilizing transposase RayT
MASTHTQVNIHFIFAVKGRENALQDDFREELHRYIAGIINKRSNMVLAINSVSDHIHIFVGLHPMQAPGLLMRDVKSASSAFINKKRKANRKFQWQDGYCAVSHSQSQRGAVIRYIKNQKKHHQAKSFREEYLELLQKFEIVYDLKYVFDEEDEVAVG